MAHTYKCDWCQWLEHEQRGGDWQIYYGVPEQRRYNIFRTYSRRYALPVLKWTGKKVIEATRDWAKDVVLHNQPPKKALKRQLIKAARTAAMEGFDQLEKKVQEGSGTREKKTKIVAVHQPIPYIGPNHAFLPKKKAPPTKNKISTAKKAPSKKKNSTTKKNIRQKAKSKKRKPRQVAKKKTQGNKRQVKNKRVSKKKKQKPLPRGLFIP